MYYFVIGVPIIHDGLYPACVLSSQSGGRDRYVTIHRPEFSLDILDKICYACLTLLYMV